MPRCHMLGCNAHASAVAAKAVRPSRHKVTARGMSRRRRARARWASPSRRTRTTRVGRLSTWRRRIGGSQLMSTLRSTAAARRLQRLGHLRACACSAARVGSGACACRGGIACSGTCARRGACACRGGSACSGACASRGGGAFKVVGIREALDQTRVLDLLRAKHRRVLSGYARGWKLKPLLY